MTLRHMKILAEVCKQGSITHAAKTLHLSQPAVSLAISELERYYGIQLFDRISRRIYITKTGEKFLSFAMHIVSTFDQMETKIKNWDNFGTLRIGSSISLGTHLLPKIVHTFSKQFPDIQVTVKIDSSDKIEALVLSNEIDLALSEGLVHSSDITSQPFFTDRLVLIVSPRHSLANKNSVDLSEILNENFLMRELGSGTRAIFDALLFAKQIKIEPLWQSSSTTAILSAVAENIGIAVLPYELVKRDAKVGLVHVLEIETLPLKRDCLLIHHRSKFLSPSMLAFLECAKEIAVHWSN